MKHIDEYRDPKLVLKLKAAIEKIVTKPWTIMEVCGGQTHSIVKFGIDEILPPEIKIIHGPGCPVCVTPIAFIDAAIDISLKENVILCSFGDMIRVPGSNQSLLQAKAKGADVRIVYSPMEVLEIAKKNPNKEVVFFAVGFETTAPTTAMLAYEARNKRIHNLSLLVTHVLVPPAMKAVLSSSENQVQGFLAAGHVCTIMGYQAYHEISKKYKTPIVVTGFEPLDILQGLFFCIKQLEEGKYLVENQYARSVHSEGNLKAQKLMEEVFCSQNIAWRGIGEIKNSGLKLNDEYIEFDTLRKFEYKIKNEFGNDQTCISGSIMQGIKTPKDCPAFGTRCTPENPLGAPMVSSEGACSAYYRYRKSS